MTDPADRPRLEEVLARIERPRRSGRLREDRVTLAHGSGGKDTQNLVDAVFAPSLANPILAREEDAATLIVPGLARPLAFTTDAFVVRPLFFPGGDIARLAVHGTINDLAAGGADPFAMAAAFVLEEGFPIDDLRRLAASMGEAARAAGIAVVAADTKVVERGKADGLYVAASGLGLVRPEARLSPAGARPGDRVLVTGPIGDHGVAILIARHDLDLECDVESDSAPLAGLAGVLLTALGVDVHAMRDATRGGVATVLNEIAEASAVGIAVEEADVPVREAVRGACELLGIDPLHMANEGRLVAIVAGDRAEEALAILRGRPDGAGAAIVGTVIDGPPGMVQVRTAIGGRRVLDRLSGDALPRIC